MDSFTFTGWYTLVFLLGLVLAICWIVLPFAVIGTKPLLRQLIQEQRRTNELLMQAASRAAAIADSSRPSAEPRHMSAARAYPTAAERATEKTRGVSAFVIALAIVAIVGLLLWFFMHR